MEKTEGIYGQLQACLDKVVNKLGPERTTFLLESFIANTTLKENEKGKIKFVLDFLVSKAIELFALEEPLFYDCDIRAYRDARMACFHLLKKYTNDTFSKIGLSFRCSERVVAYGYHTVDERLKVPKFYQDFAGKYVILEAAIINFISNIN